MENFLIYISPIGILKIKEKDDSIISIEIINTIIPINNNISLILQQVKNQLDEYFSGNSKKLEIKMNLIGTEFEKNVWNALLKVPYGKTKSYTDIAIDIGKPNSFRAVANACGKNPILLFIPCHRIISKNGDLGGFSYGIDIKEKLLNLEKKF